MCENSMVMREINKLPPTCPRVQYFIVILTSRKMLKCKTSDD